MEGNVATMADIIAGVTSLVTGSVSWLGSMVTAVVGSPLLLFFTLVGFVGIGIGLLKRFTN